MGVLLKIINGFFVSLGVIFLIIIIAGIYLFIADPFGIKPMLSSFGVGLDSISVVKDVISSGGSLDPAQLMEQFNIDPNNPPEITPAMEQCFTQKLGADRVNAIISGSQIGPADIIAGQSCLK